MTQGELFERYYRLESAAVAMRSQMAKMGQVPPQMLNQYYLMLAEQDLIRSILIDWYEFDPAELEELL